MNMPGRFPGLLPAAGCFGLLAVLFLLLASCESGEISPIKTTKSPSIVSLASETQQEKQPAPNKKPHAIKVAASSPTSTIQSSSTATVFATATADVLAIDFEKADTPQPTNQPIARNSPTPLSLVKCDQRFPGDDLLAVVTLDYGLSRDFAPDDLIPLAEHLPFSVTLGYPTEVREVMLQPLVSMINNMISDGLKPQILSGYRSYPAQAIAWEKWSTLYPDHASIISAPPGHSEHQLGTIIDFGSPELQGIVGEPDIQFHTYFYKTSEGQWLSENAHKYGFSLSYPSEAFEITGFYYEPWHYRYVGEKMARQLHEQGLTLTEFQLAEKPLPCQP